MNRFLYKSQILNLCLEGNINYHFLLSMRASGSLKFHLSKYYYLDFSLFFLTPILLKTLFHTQILVYFHIFSNYSLLFLQMGQLLAEEKPPVSLFEAILAFFVYISISEHFQSE